MRLTELFETARIIVEDTTVNRTGRQLISLSLADIYDMTLQPYPEVIDPDTGRSTQPADFFTKRQYGIGVPDENGQVEPGSIHPGMVKAYRDWQAGGALPGLLMDANGEMRPYNENSYLEDFAWRAASGLSSLGGDLTLAGAYGVDAAAEGIENGAQYLWNYVLNNGSLAGNFAKRMGASDWEDSPIDEQGIGALAWMSEDPMKLDKFAQYLDDQTDLSFRDSGDMMANAVTSGSDIIELFIGGDAQMAMSWAGFGAMYATELPKTMLDYGIMASATLIGGPGGTAIATTALSVSNAAEASGAAIAQINDVIDANYESGDLQKTPQWASAVSLAKEQMLYDGDITDTEADLTEMQTAQMEELAKSVISYNTYNAVVLPVAGTAAVLDTASDKLLLGNMRMPNPINPVALTQWAGKGIFSAQIEGVEEGLQEVWTQRGLLNEAGNPVDPSQVINAYYQGVVIGKAEAGVATATDSLGALGQKLFGQGNNQTPDEKTARSLLRTFFYGADAGDVSILIEIQKYDQDLLRNNVLNDEGRLALAEKIRERGIITDVDQKDENGEFILSRGQRRGLYRNKTITLEDGTELSREIIEQNARGLELVGFIDGMRWNAQQDRWDVNFQSEQDMIDAAKALGIDVEGSGVDFQGKRRINRIMRDLEQVYKLDARVVGRSNLEAPSWQDLSPAQKAQYVNQGFIEFTNEESDGNRVGQRWTRDDIDRTTQRDGNWDQVPQEIKDVAEPTEARPSLEGNPNFQRSINAAQDYLDSFATRAERELGQAQTRWDNRNPDADPLDADNPRPTEENDENYQDLMAASRGESPATAAYAQRRDSIMQNIGEAQEAWDAEFGRTHNRNGTPKLTNGIPTGTREGNISQVQTGRGDGEAEVDRRDQDDDEVTPITSDDITADDDRLAAPFQSPITEPFGDLARGLTVYNTKYKIASGDMAPESVATMMNKLEKTFPGITSEVFGEGGIESYQQSQEAQEQFAEQVGENPPDLPMADGPQRPMAGMEAELEGQTFVYPGGMWIAVNEDGSRGRPASKEQQQQLTDIALGRTVPILPTTPERVEDRPVYINPQRPEVQTTINDLPEYSEGDTVEYRRVDGSLNDAEFVRELDNGNIQVFKNGAVYALTPTQIAAASIDNFEITTTPPEPTNTDRTKENNWGLGVVDPSVQAAIDQRTQNAIDAGGIDNLPVDQQSEPQGFIVPPATDADQQYADVEVSDDLKQQFQAVVNTRNGIKVQQFLDAQPEDIAGALRLNPPALPANDTGQEPEVREPTGSGRGDGQAEVDARNAEREAAQQIIANQAADAEERSVRDSIRDEAKRIAAQREAEAQELAIRDSIRDQAAKEAQRMNAAEEETANREVIRNIARKIAADNNAAEQEDAIRDEIAKRAEDLANQNKEFGDAAAEELAVRNSIRDAAKEAAAAAKAEAEETAQREAIRAAAEEKAAEIAAQNQLVDDNEQDIRDEIRRRAEEEANLAAERREAEIRKQIEDQISAIEDAEAQQQAAQANDKDGDLTTPLDTTGEDPPVPQQRPDAPVPIPQPRPTTTTGGGRGDGQAEVDARNAEIKRQAQQRAQDAFRVAQQRIRDADQQAMDAEREKAAQRAADRRSAADDAADAAGNATVDATTTVLRDPPATDTPTSDIERRLVPSGDRDGEFNTTNVNTRQARDQGLPYVIAPVDGARDADGNVQTGRIYGNNNDLATKYPGQKIYQTVTGTGRGDGQAEVDARRRAQQDIDTDTQQDQTQDNDAVIEPEISQPIDQQVTAKDFEVDPNTQQDTGLATNTAMTAPIATTIDTKKQNKQQSDANNKARIGAPLPGNQEPEEPKSYNTPRFSTLAMPDPMNLMRYKSFGDSVQDTRKPVNEKKKVDEITNIRALTPDQRDAIGGYGKYKQPKPTPKPTNRRRNANPRFSTLDMPDPMGLSSYKNFGENKKKK